MAQKTIWCLNAAIELVGPNQKAIIDEFGEDNIRFGSRPQSRSATDAPAYETNNLMPGCEYFVPIAPKCIGRDFLTPDPAGYLAKIQQYYKNCGQNDYTYFWSEACLSNKGYQMITDSFEGYYSILKATAPNILIGYSQGSLVARYLEWLDKVVYGDAGVVAGAITVSSPNFGSPLANVDNKSFILKGLIKIGVVFAAGITNNLVLDGLADLIYGLLSLGGDPLTEIADVINSIIKELEKEGDKFRRLIDSLQSLMNWMGGLRNDPNDAFYDLNIGRVDEVNSVLASINSMDNLNCYGILSTNNSVEDILHPEAIGIIQQKVKDVINTKIDKDNSYAVLKKHIPDCSVTVKQEHYDKIEEIYNNDIMVEHLSKTPVNPIINRITGNYMNGIKELDVGAKAHDFVIPSSYQLTFEKNSISVDRNKVNPDANHLTGSSLKYDAGVANYENIMAKLGEIIKK